ncbi:MAG: aldo/keto reductase, partial [Brevinematia bacterium]
RAKKIVEISGRIGVLPSQLALAWVLRHDIVSTALVGTTKLKHLKENSVIVDIQHDVFLEIDNILVDEEIFY